MEIFTKACMPGSRAHQMAFVRSGFLNRGVSRHKAPKEYSLLSTLIQREPITGLVAVESFLGFGGQIQHI